MAGGAVKAKAANTIAIRLKNRPVIGVYLLVSESIGFGNTQIKTKCLARSMLLVELSARRKMKLSCQAIFQSAQSGARESLHIGDPRVALRFSDTRNFEPVRPYNGNTASARWCAAGV